MPLSIRNPKIEKLARSISARQGRSMTDVIGSALEDYDRKEKVEVDLFELAKKINATLRASSSGKGLGRNLTSEEREAAWMG